jgi:hypothetical protein
VNCRGWGATGALLEPKREILMRFPNQPQVVVVVVAVGGAGLVFWRGWPQVVVVVVAVVLVVAVGGAGLK